MSVDAARRVDNVELRVSMRAPTLRYIEEREREGRHAYSADIYNALKLEFPNVAKIQITRLLRMLIEDHKLEMYMHGGRNAYRLTEASAENVDMTIHH